MDANEPIDISGMSEIEIGYEVIRVRDVRVTGEGLVHMNARIQPYDKIARRMGIKEAKARRCFAEAMSSFF